MLKNFFYGRISQRIKFINEIVLLPLLKFINEIVLLPLFSYLLVIDCVLALLQI